MSKLLINQYYTNLDRAIQFGKSKNEMSIRTAFLNLLNEYARKQNYEVVPEITCLGTKGKAVRPDGIVKNLFGLDIGLWESKDTKTSLEDEIDLKIKTGYPLTNILFEDSETAVLFQRGEEVQRTVMRDSDNLHLLITSFLTFKSETIYNFEKALDNFKADIPQMVETLRERIDDAGTKNKNFIAISDSFLKLCKAEINPEITEADIREMMIQHILTSDIFNKIFDDPEFHKHNNIAKELEKLIETLFTYSERRNLLGELEHYYDTISASASGITDHHEKQKFLKVLYENFYKVYNPKAADRLGVVYTPNEIVNFMIDSTNYLLEKHFNKHLSDKNVEILDPATGTGTFITSIIDSIPKHLLAYKYKNEIHANEVAILPYYVANLNMEFTFKQKMGYYEEFKNLCFVDTLDNTDALAYGGKQHDLFGLSSENSARIKNQNSKTISVIIGNPPYYANQKNENENNKNREYPTIDKRIKDTYIKHSTAQKTKVYDPYARFYRWATDRIDKNGVLSFITNRSFIDSRTFDGFRKILSSEFNEIHIIDLGGDVRANPKLSGTKNNVFGIQTGVAIMLLVRKESNIKEPKTEKELEELLEDLNITREPVVRYGEDELFSTRGCRIYYYRRPEMETAKEKLDFLRYTKFEDLEFERIRPDKNNNWINLSDENDWESLVPLVSKAKNSKTLFIEYAIGSNTARDAWTYDFNSKNLSNKIAFLVDAYNKLLPKNSAYENDKSIKWTRGLKQRFDKKTKLTFVRERIIKVFYRPFVKQFLYHSSDLVEMPSSLPKLTINKNSFILFSGSSHSKPFQTYAVDNVFSFDYLEKTTGVPLFTFDKSKNRIDNITDWGLEQFTSHYNDIKITKEDIFNYTYAVLHNPAYRTKYELNLKREFPRLPYYEDFWQWAKWGKALMGLHINYETQKPFALKENTFTVKAEAKRQKEIFAIAQEPEALYGRQAKVKPKLKADKEAGIIEIDELTFLSGVPKSAWDYKLGNRSALEWILDQYKEKKSSDPTITEKFNTYRFADYKDHVIDLLKRVCTVSVETMEIINEMKNEKN